MAELEEGENIIEGLAVVDHTEPTLPLDEPQESNLPRETIAVFRGAQKEFVSLSETTAEGKRYFVGTDGHQHLETERAKKAFEDYFNMGRGRSLRRLAETYTRPEYPEWTNNVESVLRRLQDYSANLDWQNRIRLRVARDSAEALAAATRMAAASKRVRLGRTRKMQQIGEAILDKADLLDTSDLTAEQARELIKPATILLQIGLQLERAEIGESIEKIQPHKPIDKMTDDELEEYIEVLRANLQ